MPDPSHSLAATCRCLTDDLDLGHDDCARPVDELDHPVVRDFVDKRRDHPIGQEIIQALAPSLQAYSLHSGRYRGATWHQEELAVVWLLAAALHRADDARDAYAHFARLHRAGRLLPDRDDMARQLLRRAVSFATSLVNEVPSIRDRAIDQPGRVHAGTIGGRVAVRVFCESGDPPLLSVAVSQRLRPGALSLPPEWLIQLIAAFFPSAGIEQLEATSELAPDVPLVADEVCFQDFIH